MNYKFRRAAVVVFFLLVQCTGDEEPHPAVLISDVTPISGQPGTMVTITGSNFSTSPETNKVSFHGVSAEVVQATSTELVVRAPVVESSGNIEVSVNNTTSVGPKFSYYHVYCYGSKYYYAAYWIDGKEKVLTTRGHIWDLTISGSDVHAVGYEEKPTEAGYFPAYWKNGVLVPVDSITPAGRLTGIAVSGADVYICGVNRVSDVYSKAWYWKNGHLVFSTDGSTSGWARDIAASGDDVYMVGDEYPVAKMWKNGIPTSLSDGKYINQANRIRIIGTDIHIIGSELYGPETASVKYWKNGSAVELENGNPSGYAVDFAIPDSDPYVAGYSFRYEGAFSNYAVAKLWHNGEETNVFKGSSNYYCAAVEVTNDAIYVLRNEFGASHPYASVLTKNDTPITPDFGPGVTGAIQGMFIAYY